MDKRIKNLFNQSILDEAATCFGINSSQLTDIGGFENYIYQYTKNDTDYILRISHSYHRSHDMVESELDFVAFLANNHAPVSIPIPSQNNRLVERIIAQDGSYFTVTSYVKASGNPPKRSDGNEKLFYEYGKTIGTFHRLTKEYQPKDSIVERFTWDEDPLLVHMSEFLPPDDQIINQKYLTLRKRLNKLNKTKQNYGLIHTDVHMGNFFVDDNQLCVFDFDDCAYQWFISDIAIVLFYYLVNVNEEEQAEKGKSLMVPFLEGYFTENSLSKKEFQYFDLFLKLREIVLYAVLFQDNEIERSKFAKKYVENHRDKIIHDLPVFAFDIRNVL
ncbi:MAG: phosphotransferase [Bacilli bacterium]|jgi:Ser/Thr protein kinase RdoA (MazF antagonist)|nr:phosphotransferase [Bacilli bacterium]MDY0063997.1 phosphotransferase [Bacilli bacterium]